MVLFVLTNISVFEGSSNIFGDFEVDLGSSVLTLAFFVGLRTFELRSTSSPKTINYLLVIAIRFSILTLNFYRWKRIGQVIVGIRAGN